MAQLSAVTAIRHIARNVKAAVVITFFSGFNMLKCYFDLMSQPSRAVYMFLKINRVPHQLCPIAIRKGENQTEEFTKVNPFNKVPAMSDGNFNLTESNAIMKYVMNKYNLSDHWYPRDPVKQARVDEFLFWYHLNLRFNGSMYFITRVMKPMMTGREPDAKKLTAVKKNLGKTVKQFESYFIKNTPFISSNEISIADLQAICEFMQPFAAGYDVFADFPKLSQWRDQVKGELQPYFDESHQFVYQAAKRYSKL